MNRNLINRALTCVVGISLLTVFIFLLPYYNYLALAVLGVALCFFGSLEMSKMIFGKVTPIAYFTCLLPISEYLFASCNLVFFFLILAIMTFEIKAGEDSDFAGCIDTIAKKVLLVVYPAYLTTFIIRILQLYTINAYKILLFLCLVFSNDIFAYVFGMLLGKSNKGLFKVSPKKSVAGFIGGTASCIVCSLLFFCFANDYVGFPNFFFGITLGLIISITANIGDLAESVFKRSAKIKDSGNIFPGRGGVLDSLDSLIVSAPFFFLLICNL